MSLSKNGKPMGRPRKNPEHVLPVSKVVLPYVACRNCRWFVPGPEHGVCRESPAFVQRRGSDWCGRYEPLITSNTLKEEANG
jgi:hypothetical protein